MCVRARVHVCVCSCVHVRVCVCACARMHMCGCACVRACVRGRVRAPNAVFVTTVTLAIRQRSSSSASFIVYVTP